MAEHDLWLDWLDREWNRPSRTDHYLMLLAAILDDVPLRVWGRGGPLRKLSEYVLPFTVKAVSPPGAGAGAASQDGVADEPPPDDPMKGWRPPKPITARDVNTIRAADAKHRAAQLAKVRPPAADPANYTGRPAAPRGRARTNDDEVTDVPLGQPPPW